MRLLKTRWIVAVVLVILAGAGVATIYTYEKIPLLELIDTTYATDKTPGVYVVPSNVRHIEPQPIKNIAVRSLVIENLAISIPSNLALEVKVGSDASTTVVVGPGEKMLAIVPASGYGDTIKNWRIEKSPFFDERELSSLYDFQLATMQTTPDGLSLLTPSDALVRATILLSLKLSETTDASVIRPLTIGSLKAIQVGDPDKGDIIVRVFLFPDRYERIDLYFREYDAKEIALVLGSLVA